MTPSVRSAIVVAVTLPAIRHALPINSEVRWSDLLAVLIATDPLPLFELLNMKVDQPEQLRVLREVAVDAANQPDLVLECGGRRLAVIEVKVLAGLGPAQLERYSTAVPDADAYVVIFPQRLLIDVAGAPLWRGVTWETVLRAYASSGDAWVSTSATAWLAHLDMSLPRVDAETVWNGLIPGEDFVVAMRARMSWLHGQLDPPAPIEHDLVPSTAGVSWVVRLLAEATAPMYQILVEVEVEENLPVRDFPKYATPGWREPRGPSIKVCLLQYSVQTSAGFDWDYLLAMWPKMAAARSDWVANAARPRAAHDRAGHQAMVAKGGPAFLGIGFGEAQTKISGACMFGARVQLAPSVRLGEVAVAVQDLYKLIEAMAVVRAVTPAASP